MKTKKEILEHELKYYKSVYPNSKKIKEIIKKLTMISN